MKRTGKRFISSNWREWNIKTWFAQETSNTDLNGTLKTYSWLCKVSDIFGLRWIDDHIENSMDIYMNWITLNSKPQSIENRYYLLYFVLSVQQDWISATVLHLMKCICLSGFKNTCHVLQQRWSRKDINLCNMLFMKISVNPGTGLWRYGKPTCGNDISSVIYEKIITGFKIWILIEVSCSNDDKLLVRHLIEVSYIFSVNWFVNLLWAL